MPNEGCIGEIRMFAGNFAPRNWALCDGQILPINQNQALFSILGTTYGGNGQTNFALPDLRGRFAMHAGNGPGLTNRPLGQKSGVENVTLNINEIPSHSHGANTEVTEFTSANEGNSASPDDGFSAKSGAGDPDYTSDGSNIDTNLNEDSHRATTTISNAGGNQSHNNMPPFQTVNYIICLQGIFPSRN
jgi:microcystin-dependent protein